MTTYSRINTHLKTHSTSSPSYLVACEMDHKIRSSAFYCGMNIGIGCIFTGAAIALAICFNPLLILLAGVGITLMIKGWYEWPKTVTLINGKIREIPLQSNSYKQRENLSLAKEILHHVDRSALFSNQCSQGSKSSPLLFSNKCKENLLFSDKKIPHLQVASSIEKNGLKNGEAMAAMGLQYAQEIVPGSKVEMFSISGGNHHFLVIGRKEGIDPSDFENWGSDAVICDPWSGSCYPAEKLKIFLRSYAGCVSIHGMNLALIQPFNPSWQTVELVSTG